MAMASTAAQEDFSFPIITESHPLSIDSPPLWHLSPAASPNHYSSCNKSPKQEFYKQRKSCSNLETHYNNTEDDHEDEDEDDKMDILWEDYFNEEVSKLEANNKKNDNMMEMKLSKNGNGAIFSAAKKPTIVVFIKVLKKIFLLHNNSHHHNHRSVKINKAL